MQSISQTRTDLPPCADHPFRATRAPQAAPVLAAITLICAFALALYCLATGWP